MTYGVQLRGAALGEVGHHGDVGAGRDVDALGLEDRGSAAAAVGGGELEVVAAGRQVLRVGQGARLEVGQQGLAVGTDVHGGVRDGVQDRDHGGAGRLGRRGRRDGDADGGSRGESHGGESTNDAHTDSWRWVDRRRGPLHARGTRSPIAAVSSLPHGPARGMHLYTDDEIGRVDEGAGNGVAGAAAPVPQPAGPASTSRTCRSTTPPRRHDGSAGSCCWTSRPRASGVVVIAVVLLVVRTAAGLAAARRDGALRRAARLVAAPLPRGPGRRRRARRLRDVLAAAGRRPARGPVAVRRLRGAHGLPGPLRDPLRPAPHPARHLGGDRRSPPSSRCCSRCAPSSPWSPGCRRCSSRSSSSSWRSRSSGLGLTVLYAYSGRLAEVVDGLRHANEALHRSERSLEQKVVERTAELEHSREETARARDEAVGLSHELAAVLDNLGEGLLVIDAAGRVERVNRRLEEMLGRPVRQPAATSPPRRSCPSWTASAPPSPPPARSRSLRADSAARLPAPSSTRPKGSPAAPWSWCATSRWSARSTE